MVRTLRGIRRIDGHRDLFSEAFQTEQNNNTDTEGKHG